MPTAGDKGAAGRARATQAAIAAHHSTFEAAARRAEAERTLPADVVALMKELGLFWLKTPVELGGSQLDPTDFCDVAEDLAYLDASVAWAAMVGNGTTGAVAGWIDAAGAAEVFGGPELPICAGQFPPRGRAVPVEGGYRVSGRWTFSSGIGHADWVVGGARISDEAHLPDGDGTILLFLVPKAEATVHDVWHVAGLQGTGSNDFSLDDVFVPTRRTLDWFRSPARHPGALYHQERALFLTNELSPLAVGIARRALDDLRSFASQTTRTPNGMTVGDRAVFQWELGRADSRIRAARLLYRDAVERGWRAALEARPLEPAAVAAIRADHTWVVETCSETVSQLFRYAGGRGLYLDNPMQRHVRNLLAAGQNIQVNNEAYELAGKATLAPLGG